MSKLCHLIAGILCLGAVGSTGATSHAQEPFPSRQVRVIVPFPPGSTLDTLVRIVTDQLAPAPIRFVSLSDRTSPPFT
jgi:tripartite-type tricarboxylate transporter receptor subunit TctC